MMMRSAQLLFISAIGSLPWVVHGQTYRDVMMSTGNTMIQRSNNGDDDSLDSVHMLMSRNMSRARTLVQRQKRQDRHSHRLLPPHRIEAKTIPKYKTELRILPVLHDDQGKDNSHFEVAVRQFEQQMLPEGYPKTLVWGFGDPSNPYSFHHPAGSMEVTRQKNTYVTWRNELLEDPVACQAHGPSHSGCNYVKHLLQDKFGTPVVDTTLHWAAPDRRCANGKNQTDCTGPNTPHPYLGPSPFVPHVHGSHVESRSDGYPESWFLPKASNIPKGYATAGTRFRSRYLPSKKVPDDGNKYVKNPGAGDKFFEAAADEARGQGYAVYRYTNDQETTALWYHDHTLGMTRLNVNAMGSGFWFIRTAKDGELRLAARDATNKIQSLPGPPPQYGKNPNDNAEVRKQIRWQVKNRFLDSIAAGFGGGNII